MGRVRGVYRKKILKLGIKFKPFSYNEKTKKIKHAYLSNNIPQAKHYLIVYITQNQQSIK